MRYVYEFIGTFFLVLTIGMTVLEPHSAGIMAPVAIGSVLAAMVYAGGHLSGAHYNPAVSLALFIRGNLSLKDLGLYGIVQLAAAVIAGYLTVYFKGFPTPVPLSMEVPKALLAEFLFTFALCFVILNVVFAKGTKGNSFYGLAIGIIVVIAAYAIGPISGAALNPAVALGLVVMQLSSLANLWIYFVATFLGAICVALLFKAVESKA